MTDPVFYHLSSRALVRLRGPEADDLLEDIVTCSISDLPPAAIRHGALLTPQGRVLFDLIISRDDKDILLELDADRREALIGRLTLYRMRRDVRIDPDEAGVHAVIGAAPEMRRDLRFAEPAGRVYGPVAAAQAEDAFIRLRWQQGIYEGYRELIPEKALPLEARLDLNAGINFEKGCYIGQEVTARTRYRGLIKKTYMTVMLEEMVETPAPLQASDKDAGDLLTVLPMAEGAIGVAVIRLTAFEDKAEGMPAIMTTSGLAVRPLLPPRLMPLPGQAS